MPYCEIASKVATTSSLKVQRGDVIVSGSDGLFDNVFDEEIIEIVSRLRGGGFGPVQLSSSLASTASMHSRDTGYFSPFAKEMADQGLLGGGQFLRSLLSAPLASLDNWLLGREDDGQMNSTSRSRGGGGGKPDDITVLVTVIM